MSCHEAQTEFLGGHSSPHLESCPTCAVWVQDLESLEVLVRASREPPPARAVQPGRPGRRPRWLPAGLAAAAVLAMGLWWGQPAQAPVARPIPARAAATWDDRAHYQVDRAVTRLRRDLETEF